jgi:Flp pilus assembly protein TadG
MTRKFRLLRDAKGAAAIEVALAIPILLELFWVVFQAGLVFRAMSGIQHGLGEGARYATLFPQPSNAQIKSRIEDTVYGIGPGHFTISTPSAGSADGANYLDLTVSYTQSTDLIFIPGPTVTVSRSKRVWVSS